jgi:ubiquinone/menaquinone biosynthesis C-methylase UbiE
MTDRVRQSFDVTAEAYAGEFADELDRKPFDRNLLVDFAASLPRGATALDVGTGAAGHIGRFLADQGLTVTGVDLSPKAIAVAQELNPNIRFVLADFRSLPIADDTFDAVVGFYCFIYGTDVDISTALTEALRVVRSGGRLLAAVHATFDDRPREESFTEMLGLPVDISVRFTTPATFAGLVERAGWRIDTVQVRDPYESEHRSRRVYVSARKP